MELVEALVTQAKGGEAVVQGDVAMAFNRVARAVRQTIMLQSKLIEALQERHAAVAGRKAAAKASAARIVRGVIDDERISDTERAEGLTAEAAERLREEDFGDLLARPFAEAVADICKDLGLSPDWLALAEDCAATAEAALAGQAGRSRRSRGADTPDPSRSAGWTTTTRSRPAAKAPHRAGQSTGKARPPGPGIAR